MGTQKHRADSKNIIGIDELRTRRKKRIGDGHQGETNARQNTPANRMGKRRKARRNAMLVMGFVSLLAIFLVMGWQVLTVKHIQVTGLETITQEDVLRLADIQSGQSILKINGKKIRDNIESGEPLLEVKDVKITFPDKLVLTVKERHARALFRYQSEEFFLDEQCWVLGTKKNSAASALPGVVGLEAGLPVIGKALPVSNTEAFRALTALLDMLAQKNCLGDIATIDMSNPMNIQMMSLEGIVVSVGRPEGLDYKVGLLKGALRDLRSQSVSSGVLYLTADNGASYSKVPTGTGAALRPWEVGLRFLLGQGVGGTG